MIYLILAIVFTSMFFVIFRIVDNLKLPLLPVIVVNYLLTSITSFAYANYMGIFDMANFTWDVIWPALMVGSSFVFLFVIMGIASAKAGVGKTAMSNRLNVIIPVVFSIIYFSEPLPAIKIISIILGIIALALSVMKKDKGQPTGSGENYYFLLFLIFFVGGATDAFLGLVQDGMLNDTNQMNFFIANFMTAFLGGLIFSTLKGTKVKTYFKPRSLGMALALSVSNFLAFFGFINGLGKSGLDESEFFTTLNIGIVVFTILWGILLFRERYSLTNWAGIGLAIVSIILLLQYETILAWL
jgi:drug/metabolite transporter (DMT)-like permease